MMGEKIVENESATITRMLAGLGIGRAGESNQQLYEALALEGIDEGALSAWLLADAAPMP